MSKGVLNLGNAVNKLLLEYGDQVFGTVDEVCEEAAKDGMKKIRQNSKKRTGVYARDWRVKQSKQGKLGFVWIVYNKDHYRLAHLLENDHDFVTRRGGERVKLGTWKGDNVIHDVDEYEQDWLYDETVRRLSSK